METKYSRKPISGKRAAICIPRLEGEDRLFVARMPRNLDGRNDFIVVRCAIRIKITGVDKRPIGSYTYCIRMAVAPRFIRPRTGKRKFEFGDIY